mmetsp:Transcript_47875/g.88055  ORF Transcript_47875/g.88055 Transcript_47875/m.88055 type:complete len:288 (-) Transcript_47875:558-1421(-)
MEGDSEAFSQLHLLELLLLQHEGKLGHVQADRDSNVAVDPVQVLQLDLLLLLAESSNVWISGDGVILGNALTHLLDEGSAWQYFHCCSAAISLGHCDLLCGITIDGCDLSSCWGRVDVDIAVVALWVDLTTTTVAAKVEGVLAKADLLAWSGRKHWSNHLFRIAVGHWARHQDIWLLLAPCRPGQTLHLLLQWLGQAILWCELPSLWHDDDASNVHGGHCSISARLLLLVVCWHFHDDLEDGVGQHLMRHAHLDWLATQVAVCACNASVGLNWLLVVLLREDGEGLG